MRGGKGRPYQKRGWWYSPRWRNPVSGELHDSFALQTRDATAAEVKWVQFQAAQLARSPLPVEKGQQTELAAVVAHAGTVTISEAVEAYLRHKGDIQETTRRAYRQYWTLIQRRIPDRLVSAMSGAQGTAALQELYDAARAEEVSNHTLWKWIVGLMVPVLRYAHARGWVAEMPTPPAFASDYQTQDKEWTVEEFAAFRAEVPEETFIRGVKVWARMLVDVGAMTGMHIADLIQFRWAVPTGSPFPGWNRLGRRWWRVTSKAHRAAFRRGARQSAGGYRPEWLECEPRLQRMLEAEHDRRHPAPDDTVLVDETARIFELTLPIWVTGVNQLFGYAAKRAGLASAPSTLWLRHFCAQRCRDNGWERAETAKLLGNSGAIVDRVYAAISSRRMGELVRDRGMSAELDATAPAAEDAATGFQEGRRAATARTDAPVSRVVARPSFGGRSTTGSKSGSKAGIRRGLTVGNHGKRSGELRIKSPQLYQLSYGPKPPKNQGGTPPDTDTCSVPGSKSGRKNSPPGKKSNTPRAASRKGKRDGNEGEGE